jgi:hypothetical protein
MQKVSLKSQRFPGVHNLWIAPKQLDIPREENKHEKSCGQQLQNEQHKTVGLSLIPANRQQAKSNSKT